MKKTLFILIVCSSLSLRAQDVFTIVKVVGKIENGRLGREVKTGDKIESRDALRFTSPASYLIIISPKTGRKVIHSVPDDSPREIIKLLESFVKPAERSTATRTIGMAYIDELGSSMSFHTLLILGEGKIPVDTKQLSLRPPAGVKAYYLKGTQQTYRKISDDQFIYLNKSALFGADARGPFHRVALQYYKNEYEDPLANPGIPVAAFVPLFVDESAFAGEVGAIVNALGNATPQTIFDEVEKYILAEYGGVQHQNLRDWLVQNRLIKE